MEDGVLAEFLIERKEEMGIVGNIYKGKVVRVLPGMQAAFVDIGMDKAAFLHASDFYEVPEEVQFMMESPEEVEFEEPPNRRPHRGGCLWKNGFQPAGKFWCKSPKIRSAPKARASPRKSRCQADTWFSCRTPAMLGFRGGLRATTSASA